MRNGSEGGLAVSPRVAETKGEATPEKHQVLLGQWLVESQSFAGGLADLRWRAGGEEASGRVAGGVDEGEQDRRRGNDGEQEDRLEVTLSSPAAGLNIATQADVVRRSQRDLAISFSEISEGDVALLTQITVAYYRLAR